MLLVEREWAQKDDRTGGQGMLVLKQKGDYKRLNGYLERVKEIVNLGELNTIGRKGVAALSSYTPIDTGETSASWSYNIERTKKGVSIVFSNSNVNDGVNIAIILQTGHATRNGGWVDGRDYINPALQPVFDQLAADAWEEVSKV